MTEGYLVGCEAVDVARLTGLKLKSPRHELEETGDIDPGAVDAARAMGGNPVVFLDLARLPVWDQWAVAWARIGAYEWLSWN